MVIVDWMFGVNPLQIYLCGCVCRCRKVGKVRYLLMKEAWADHTPLTPAVRTT